MVEYAKISELPAAGSAAGTDMLETNQAGVTRRITVSQLLDVGGGTAAPSGPAGGDLAGSYPDPTVKANVSLTGIPLTTKAAAAANTNQIASATWVQGELANYVSTGAGNLNYVRKIGDAMTGKLSLAASDNTVAGLTLPHGNTPGAGIVNGDIWTKTDGLWGRINGVTVRFSTLTDLTAGYQPLDADLTALAGLNATAGLVEQTGAAAFTKRAIGVAAATDVLTRANGDARYAPVSVNGTVTGVSVVSANGLAGTATATATPAITLSTTVNGMVKGNATALSAAVAGTDYVSPSGLTTALGSYLPTAGGALTGALTGTSATFANDITTNGGQFINDRTGDAAVSLIQLRSDATLTAGMQLMTGATSRWQIMKSAGAETGSDAGSDLAIYAYTDAGAFLGTAMSITRATRAVAFGATLSATLGSFTSHIITTGGYMMVDRQTDAASADIYLRTDAAQTANVWLDTGSGHRWGLIKNQTAESGSNAGSDFHLWAYTDAGASIGPAMTVTRATRAMTLFGALTGTSATFSSVVSATTSVAVTGAAGGFRNFTLQTGGLNRWSMSENNAAEAGSDAGSDYNIISYTDAGAFKAIPFAINRATGNTTLTGTLTGTTAAFSGAVTSVTAAPGTNTTQLASTAFVTAALAAGASISVGTTPPGSPTANQLWWNSDASIGGGQLFIYFDSYWVPASPAASAGTVVQTVVSQTGAMTTGATVIPADDTIPQITEGNEYMTCSITPTSATSRLIIDVTFNASTSATGTVTAALFQDATANALAAGFGISAFANLAMSPIRFTHTMVSGSTSARTYRVRGGSHNAGTMTFNGMSGVRTFGGMIASSIVIQEVL